MKVCSSVSVIVVSYNPCLEKMIITLSSIIAQENVVYEIIIADDGSENDLQEDIFLFMNYVGKGFKFIKNSINNGTVKNVERALKACEYEYVKLISPGDFFAHKYVLSDWISVMTNKKARLSFCDVMFYRDDGIKYKILKKAAYPQNIHIYVKKQYKKIKRWYLLVNDLIIGASTICKLSIMEQYISLISGKVVYAEDNIYRLMINDGIYPVYYNDIGLLYEFGTGISTNGNTHWEEKLKKDWFETDRIIMNSENDLDFQKKFRYLSDTRTQPTVINKLKRFFICKEILAKKFIPVRYSKEHMTDEMVLMCKWINKLKENYMLTSKM